MLDEYAVRVYLLVEHALRLEAEDKLWNVISSRAAMTDKRQFNQLVNRLERASHDILEQEDYDITRLKSILGEAPDGDRQ